LAWNSELTGLHDLSPLSQKKEKYSGKTSMILLMPMKQSENLLPDFWLKYLTIIKALKKLKPINHPLLSKKKEKSRGTL
jgi:hypothetical protein